MCYTRPSSCGVDAQQRQYQQQWNAACREAGADANAGACATALHGFVTARLHFKFGELAILLYVYLFIFVRICHAIEDLELGIAQKPQSSREAREISRRA